MTTSIPPHAHASAPILRVSVATLCRVTFDHPLDGSPWLAFERRATLRPGPPPHTTIITVPYGGAVRLLDLAVLAEVVPDFQYDSERSQAEQDFRLLIPAAAWPNLREFCLTHLAHDNDPVIDAAPGRELAEEFAETIHWQLSRDDYTAVPVGTFVEDTPTPTISPRSPGTPTVRLHRIFAVQLLNPGLIQALLASTAQTNTALALAAEANAAQGGLGRANAALALPAAPFQADFAALPAPTRTGAFVISGHTFDPSAAALFPEIANSTRQWYPA